MGKMGLELSFEGSGSEEGIPGRGGGHEEGWEVNCWAILETASYLNVLG